MIVDPVIRLAQPEDARAIAQMSRDYIEQGLGWGWTQARVLRAIADGATNVAVLHERGCLLGFGIMQYGDERAHLALLGVQPTQRRKGIAAHLVHWLEHCARTAGLERITVEARADNPGAIAFYRGQGYAQRERITGYYRGRVDALRLEKILSVRQQA